LRDISHINAASLLKAAVFPGLLVLQPRRWYIDCKGQTCGLGRAGYMKKDEDIMGWRPMERTRLAIDIGGTFTDLALEHAGGLTTAKVLTTPSAPEKGVMTGVQTILQAAGLKASDIELLIHGTTLATNAIIERKGAKTALITTEGFRDVLALRNESRYDQYDLNIVLPEPLVPRYLRLGVPERLDNQGRVLKPLDERAVRELIPFLQDQAVESIAIGFLHGFVNPAHERRAAEILGRELPGIPITLASEVSPEMREWERFSTAAANAYVQPLMARYLRRLEKDLRETGLTAPIFTMLSGGNLTTVETACRFPIRLVESGPAGGAIFSASAARALGIEKVLSFDMGGTTAKICLIDGYAPQTSRSFEVARAGRFKKGSGLPLRIPVIEMVEIGAGGGSLAKLDALGRIVAGPESAGAEPGPACYGRGGNQPAVTDANLLLGRYDPVRFAGGSLTLDSGAAETALTVAVAQPLGLETGMAALGVIEIVDENMANAARVHAIESGKTYQGRTMIAFGGGGPVHGTRVAEKTGIGRVLVPSGAGVGSAIGFLRTPVGYEVVRSLYQRLGDFDLDAVNTLLAAMAANAASIVAQGSFGAVTEERRIAYMRYAGQGHEIAVPLPARPLEAADVPAIRAAYEAEYTRFYDRPVPGSGVEVLSYSVTVATLLPPRAEPPPPAAGYRAEPVRTQMVRDTATGVIAAWAVFDRDKLRPGAYFEGPAIVAEAETSILAGPGWSGRATPEGYIELTRETA
jgi:N-methylhydantoinase A